MTTQCECESDGWSEGMHDPECQNYQPPQITDAPERIWLCHGDISGELGNIKHTDCDGVTWCIDIIDSSDVEYVRADQLAELQALVAIYKGRDDGKQLVINQLQAEVERLKLEVQDRTIELIQLANDHAVLKSCQMVWQPIETAPKGKTVLIHYLNSVNKHRVVKAMFIERYTNENDGDDSEYCEEKDCYFTPEGWYEQVDNWDEYASCHVNEGAPDFWMPLPTIPSPPLPGGQS